MNKSQIYYSKKNLLLILLLATIFSCNTDKKPNISEHIYCPLLRKSNGIIAFDSLSVENIQISVRITKEKSNELLSEVIHIRDRDFNNTMRVLDQIYNLINQLKFPLELINSVHPDSLIRNSCGNALNELNAYVYDININDQLYKAIQEYSATDEAKRLPMNRRRFLDKTLQKYKRNGFDLTSDKRKKIKQLQISIDRLGMLFQNNIASDNSFLIINPNETRGLDSSFLNPRKTDEGKYKIDLSKPSYFSFMKFSKNDSLRKELLKLNYNRAVPDNLLILDSLLYYRNELANILNYKNYSEYILENKMAQTYQNVLNFENSFVNMLKEKGKEDYGKLLSVKSDVLKKKCVTLEEWEQSYYLQILKESDFSLNEKELSRYFELNHVLDGLFQITQRLFGVRYEEIKMPKVWHPEVRAFNCFDNEQNVLLGRFYLDLFPRPNKYSHAAMFTITPGMFQTHGIHQLPEAALVCNFPKPDDKNPSLLFHNDVETIFHEFGHLLHCLLAKTELSSQSGPESVPQDFAEAPSQIWENWAYQKATLTLFAKDYKTGESIPDALLDKLILAKRLNSGLDALRQMFYGLLDLTLHTKYVPFGKETSTDFVKKIKKEITGFDYMEDTYPQASFGHLIEYGSSYYGYMWSKVYAQDMWSLFEEQGILNSDLGRLYRSKILEPGGSKEPLDQVKNFLGREPNTKALLKDIGLKF